VFTTKSRPTRRMGGNLGIGILTAGMTLALAGTPAAAAPSAPALANKLVRQVTIDNINRHLIAFQRFADRAGGTRANYTAGFTGSLDYVTGKLRGAGFDVSQQELTFDRRITDAASVVVGSTRLEPFPIIHTVSSPVGGVTGTLLAVPVDANTGCEAADYAGLNATGAIALIKRGGCSFTQKQAVAADQGAAAALVYNTLGGPGRGILAGGPAASRIPTGLITVEEGAQLVALNGTTTTVEIRTHTVPTVTHNVIAQTRTGRKDNVILSGAQLDSEDDVPGMNDNASGAAAQLELALQLGGSPRINNAVRFVFWGGEWTQSGSRAYIDSLDFEAQLDVAMYLHFDMLGSMNGGYFVYDGDNNTGIDPGPHPFGSAQIEKTFTDFLNGQGIQTEATNYDTNTDHPGFTAIGIPTGGLYTGSFVGKTPAQVAKWGGTAGLGFDPCHQRSCDNLGNVNRPLLDKMADAMANTVAGYAISTEDVNGVPPRPARAAARAAIAKSAKALTSAATG
jgi:Zn-dependent M28 family amino/carboxypeptidase